MTGRIALVAAHGQLQEQPSPTIVIEYGNDCTCELGVTEPHGSVITRNNEGPRRGTTDGTNEFRWGGASMECEPAERVNRLAG